MMGAGAGAIGAVTGEPLSCFTELSKDSGAPVILVKSFILS